MHTIATKDVESIARLAQGLTLEEGINMLRGISRVYLHRTVFADDQEAKKFQFIDLLSVPGMSYVLMSHQDRIWFHGGPPGERGWYSGTPCEFFMDCIFNAILLHGREYIATCLYVMVAKGAP